MDRAAFLSYWARELERRFPNGNVRQGSVQGSFDEWWIQVDIATPDLRLLVEGVPSKHEIRVSVLTDRARSELRGLSDELDTLKRLDANDRDAPPTLSDFPSEQDTPDRLRQLSRIWDTNKHGGYQEAQAWVAKCIDWWIDLLRRRGPNHNFTLLP